MNAERTHKIGNPPKISMIAIGNELLVGSTRDINIFELGSRATRWGLELAEACIIRDDKELIIKTVREQSKNYDYVFTSGGIGPTHDDITADAIAAAFSVLPERNAEAMRVMESRESRTAARGKRPSAGASKMAMIPRGATLIPNRVSAAPGFRLGNVFVLAGVPVIFSAMLDEIGKELSTGKPLHSRTVTVLAGESHIASKLTEMQAENPEAEIGSYPQQDSNGNYFVKAVWRSYDERTVCEEVAKFKEWLAAAGIEYLD